MSTRHHWASWLGHVLFYVRAGNMARAANYLACCLPDEEHGEIDRQGARRMFTHREIASLCVELWFRMAPLITPECFEDVENTLRGEYGWKISPEPRQILTAFRRVREVLKLDSEYRWFDMTERGSCYHFLDTNKREQAMARVENGQVVVFLRNVIGSRLFYVDHGVVSNAHGEILANGRASD